MVFIPAGEFNMGSPSGESGRQRDELLHRVTISRPFYMGRYEVTNARYRMLRSGHDSREYERLSFNGSNQPVLHVSWNDAKAYCDWSGSGLRLPTEAEWEYSCRAGTKTAYHWGESPDDGKGWCNSLTPSVKKKFSWDWPSFKWEDGFTVTSPVGKFRANAWGLFDMHGNVWEWTNDWYGKYPKNAVVDPQGPSSGEHRILRGGSWLKGPQYCRSARRADFAPDFTSFSMGFRVVRGL